MSEGYLWFPKVLYWKWLVETELLTPPLMLSLFTLKVKEDLLFWLQLGTNFSVSEPNYFWLKCFKQFKIRQWNQNGTSAMLVVKCYVFYTENRGTILTIFLWFSDQQAGLQICTELYVKVSIVWWDGTERMNSFITMVVMREYFK